MPEGETRRRWCCIVLLARAGRFWAEFTRHAAVRLSMVSFIGDISLSEKWTMKLSGALVAVVWIVGSGCADRTPNVDQTANSVPSKRGDPATPSGKKENAMPSSLATVLRACIAAPDRAAEQLHEVRDENVASSEEARLICELLAMTPDERPEDGDDGWPLHQITAFFQQVESQEAFDVLQRDGVPVLCQIFDQRSDWDDFRTESDLHFVLKILAMYRSEVGSEYVVKAAKIPFKPDGYLWEVILRQFDEEHPYSIRVMRELSEPLPQGFLGVALLDAANRLALSEIEFRHPFDSDEGMTRLTAWLRSQNEDKFSYAVSATASLPFLSHPGTHDLLALALDHVDIDVQIEGAWAAVKMNNANGEKLLQRWCEDPRYSARAVQYLEDLGLSDSVPAKALEPNFASMAEMCSWLAHPNEFGRVPDHIELFDTRVLFWPPTDDRRRVWLFKYHYAPREPGDEPDDGLGMVGSVTFALFGLTKADLSPLEAYALHCCWELSCKDDARAPEEATIEEGMRLLKEANRGLKE